MKQDGAENARGGKQADDDSCDGNFWSNSIELMDLTWEGEVLIFSKYGSSPDTIL